jgi:hypothetical protein
MLSPAVAFFALLPSIGSQTTVQNPGIELTPALSGWEVETHLQAEPGRAPTVGLDSHDAKERETGERRFHVFPASLTSSTSKFSVYPTTDWLS